MGRPIGSYTFKVDPLCNPDDASRVLSACISRRERRIVHLRETGMRIVEIAGLIDMSNGWTCEMLTEIRLRCGWPRAVQKKKKKRRKRRRP